MFFLLRKNTNYNCIIKIICRITQDFAVFVVAENYIVAVDDRRYRAFSRTGTYYRLSLFLHATAARTSIYFPRVLCQFSNSVLIFLINLLFAIQKQTLNAHVYTIFLMLATFFWPRKLFSGLPRLLISHLLSIGHIHLVCVCLSVSTARRLPMFARAFTLTLSRTICMRFTHTIPTHAHIG